MPFFPFKVLMYIALYLLITVKTRLKLDNDGMRAQRNIKSCIGKKKKKNLTLNVNVLLVVVRIPLWEI